MNVCVFFHQSKELLFIEAVVNDGVYSDVSWEYKGITMVRKFTFIYPNMISALLGDKKHIYSRGRC